MTSPVTGVTGPSGERPPASAETIAEARLRQAERLRAAQAETTKPTEVVEESARSDAAEIARKPMVQPYRVNLEGGTGRMYTEVLDTATGDVIMRIPAGYRSPDEVEEAEGDGGGGDDGGTGRAAPPGGEIEA
ncbi:hypothetical protein [Azospirillum sp. ST 5-10]|uniref:hypothetical protein n=1 Tax=unclassified Azospirillum TaxID=2630922 RepID=UPI003F49B99C